MSLVLLLKIKGEETLRLEKITARALKSVNGDRYKLALIVAKRADQLSSGHEPLIDVDINKVKLADIALMEIAEGKITLDAFIDKE